MFQWNVRLRDSVQSLSMQTATPIPPPMQREAQPLFAPSRSMAYSRVT